MAAGQSLTPPAPPDGGGGGPGLSRGLSHGLCRGLRFGLCRGLSHGDVPWPATGGGGRLRDGVTAGVRVGGEAVGGAAADSADGRGPSVRVTPSHAESRRVTPPAKSASDRYFGRRGGAGVTPCHGGIYGPAARVSRREPCVRWPGPRASDFLVECLGSRKHFSYFMPVLQDRRTRMRAAAAPS